MSASRYGMLHTLVALGVTGIWTHAWSVPGSVVLVRRHRSAQFLPFPLLTFPPRLPIYFLAEHPSRRPPPIRPSRTLPHPDHHHRRALLVPSLAAPLPYHPPPLPDPTRHRPLEHHFLRRDVAETARHASDGARSLERDERRVWGRWREMGGVLRDFCGRESELECESSLAINLSSFHSCRSLTPG